MSITNKFISIFDLGGMMFAVVVFHCFFRQKRFQCIGRIGQWGQCKCHKLLCLYGYYYNVVVVLQYKQCGEKKVLSNYNLDNPIFFCKKNT